MKCDLFVLAEGVASDSRGALTLVGVNQRVISSAGLPFRAPLKAVIAFTTETDGADGPDYKVLGDGELRVRVTDPLGAPQFAVSQGFRVPAEKPQGELPVVVNIVADILISGDSYGTYSAEISFRFADGDEEARCFPIYVIPSTPAGS